jgi:hypothetical protein
VSSTKWPSMDEIGHHLLSSSIGIVHANRFFKALQKAGHTEETSLVDGLRRTLTVESWLRHLTGHGVLANQVSDGRQANFSSLERAELSASAQHKSLVR